MKTKAKAVVGGMLLALALGSTAAQTPQAYTREDASFSRVAVLSGGGYELLGVTSATSGAALSGGRFSLIGGVGGTAAPRPAYRIALPIVAR